MVFLIACRIVIEEVVIMIETKSPEEIIFFLSLMILGIIAVLLTFAFMVYGDVEQ